MGSYYENAATGFLFINLVLLIVALIMPWFVEISQGCQEYTSQYWAKTILDCKGCQGCTDTTSNWQDNCSGGKCPHLIPIWYATLVCVCLALLIHLIMVVMFALFVLGKIQIRGSPLGIVSAIFCLAAVLTYGVGLPMALKADNQGCINDASPCTSFIGSSNISTWGPGLGWIFVVCVAPLEIIIVICFHCASDFGSRV